ncbi:MAG TPA: CBS domain-containing protein [Pseudomonadales bacterium]|nr:CBS domain-containing protein [Pseudomonadales bacterium]
MRSVKVADYMTRKLVTFTPSTPLYEALTVMLESRISGAPVVDDDGGLVGVLSEIDFLEAMLKGSYHGHVEGTVGDVMTEGAQTVQSDVDIYSVSEMFLGDKRRRLPVMEDGRLVGQISRRDVLRAIKDWTEEA